VAQLLAIDAGTTGVRALLVDERGQVLDVAYRELLQSYPSPGLVEHDADEIWRSVVACVAEVAGRANGPIASIGITNQRETVVAFDRHDGQARGPAIVWQDKRTAEACRALSAAGASGVVRERTGLTIDPYFSATKMSWLLTDGRLEGARQPSLGTVDAWLLYKLSGGPGAGRFATDASNASRTLLYDLDTGDYDDELLELFGIQRDHLAEIAPSCGRFATVRAPELSGLAGTPISAILGDQQAALFGQRCLSPGMVKVTYGTGAFVLAQQGTQRPAAVEGLLTTVAWDLGEHGARSFALEGSAFIAGAAVQWLRDQLGLIDAAAELEPLARSVPAAEGLRFIPAFVGLGSPFWDEGARGALFGITRGSGRAQLANAVIDALAFEVRAITDQMAPAGAPLQAVRVDGGAAAMDLLLERLATQTDLAVSRPASLESTAIGAALLAGLAEGLIGSLDELEASWSLDATFSPAADRSAAEAEYRSWLSSLERSRTWR
jgi:glycerol kinase